MSGGEKIANWYDLEKGRVDCFYSFKLWSDVYEAGASEEEIKQLREYHDTQQWAEFYKLHHSVVEKKFSEGVKK